MGYLATYFAEYGEGGKGVAVHHQLYVLRTSL